MAALTSSPFFVNHAKNHPTANLLANQSAVEHMTPMEKEVLIDLRQTYMESTDLEILQHRSIFEVEVCIDDAYKRIFDERKLILSKFKDGPLKKFWMLVFKTAGILLSEDDEEVMVHLIDVRSKMHSEPKVKMTIEFEFEKNDFFSNELLSKTYYIKCTADTKNAVIYDGIEITSTEGTKINWLRERSVFTAQEDRHYSFFDFFDDHTESENTNRGVLGEEIAFGFFLREKVIPKAIYFFTGDIRIQRLDLDSEEQEELVASEGDIDAEYDGDSEGDSEAELQSENQQYIEFENELDSKGLADHENVEQQNNSSQGENQSSETEKQPLIDTGDES